MNDWLIDIAAYIVTDSGVVSTSGYTDASVEGEAVVSLTSAQQANQLLERIDQLLMVSYIIIRTASSLEATLLCPRPP